jgi:hypothetical protein
MNTTIKELKTMMNQIITASETTDTDYLVQFRKYINHHQEKSFDISVCFFYKENEKESCTTVFLFGSNTLTKNNLLLNLVFEAIKQKITIEELKVKYGGISEANY